LQELVYVTDHGCISSEIGTFFFVYDNTKHQVPYLLENRTRIFSWFIMLQIGSGGSPDNHTQS